MGRREGLEKKKKGKCTAAKRSDVENCNDKEMWLISLRNFTSFGNKTMVQNSQILFKPKPSLKRISFLPVLCFIFPFQKADPSSKSQLVILIATFSV